MTDPLCRETQLETASGEMTGTQMCSASATVCHIEVEQNRQAKNSAKSDFTFLNGNDHGLHILSRSLCPFQNLEFIFSLSIEGGSVISSD